MAGFKVDGFDELQRSLQRMAQNAKKLEGRQSIPFNDLFTPSFMRKYTRFSSIDALLEAGGFQANINEEFDAIPQESLDAHVSRTTKFKSWEDMLQEATEQYIQRKLGF